MPFNGAVRWRYHLALNVLGTNETEYRRLKCPAGELTEEMNPDISRRIEPHRGNADAPPE